MIGTGGREHALALSLSRDPAVTELHCGPGNPGMAALGPVHDGRPDRRRRGRRARRADRRRPGRRRARGAAGRRRRRRRHAPQGIACFGPSGEAARIEGSKAFAKDVMAAAGVPTARARSARPSTRSPRHSTTFGAPYVVKDDGLAAGKGVVVTDDREAALAPRRRACGAGVVVEEFLDGPEVSLFAVTDGATAYPLQPARTSSGSATATRARTPAAWAPTPRCPGRRRTCREVMRTVVQPTVDEMARRGTPFRGCSTPGWRSPQPGPRVIEFNCPLRRPRDPAGARRPRVAAGRAAARRRRGTAAPTSSPPGSADGAAVSVVLASAGYPGVVVEG